MIGLETVTYNERSPNQREIEMDNYLNENNMSKEMNWDTFVPTREIRNMSKEMNWDTFVPTREIREYDRRLRESIRQREQLKVELAELEKRNRDIFWDVEYAMLSAGIKYFNTCSEYWLYKLESEYIKAEKEYLAKQTDI